MQLSEHPDNVSGKPPLAEKKEGGVGLTSSEDENSQDERYEKAIVDDNADDEQNEEEPDADDIALSSFRSRLRKLLLFLVAVWLTWAVLRSFTKPRTKVVHANRYSEDFKFRPAASPIVTETLKDGRTRIRGAEPTDRTMPPQRYGPKSKEKESKPKKRRSRKRKASGRK